MTQTPFFGADAPIAAAALPSNSTSLSWYNVQRQRLRKFAKQYATVPATPVATLRSQGEPDVTIPEVVFSREGFTQLRRDLPVLDQYYEYSGEAAILAKVKEICLAWVRTNVPDGKPINESNLEWLVRVLKRRRADFTASEWGDAAAWLQALRAAKEGFAFVPNENEGSLRHGNWYTHHYKVLLLVLDALGADKAALLAEMDGFAARNFPFGNAAISHPAPGEPFDPLRHDMPRAAVTAGESIDYIRRDALHYQVYDLAPWIEIGLLTGGRYAGLIEDGFAFFTGKLLSPERHYEFAASSDPFDAARWQASHPEYLAPEAMFKPSRAAGMVLSWFAWKRSRAPAYVEPAWLVSLCGRATDTLASFWPQYFRWALGYGNG